MGAGKSLLRPTTTDAARARPWGGRKIAASWVAIRGVVKGVVTMKWMKILAEATIAGALGFTAVGLGAGDANANPPSPVVSGDTVGTRPRMDMANV